MEDAINAMEPPPPTMGENGNQPLLHMPLPEGDRI
jgi:hypothetical protein